MRLITRSHSLGLVDILEDHQNVSVEILDPVLEGILREPSFQAVHKNDVSTNPTSNIFDLELKV